MTTEPRAVPTPSARAAAPDGGSDRPELISGSAAILRSLAHLGIKDVFGIPGGAILPAYDPIFDSERLRHILVRHEQGAGHAATGYAQVTGRPVLVNLHTAVIGAPMYNFSLPSQLKAWIDRILVAGVTFRYTANGPEGLTGGKRVIVALARGGFYDEASPAAALEHLETYLRGIFNFIGIEPEFLAADGLAVSAEQRAAAIRQALGDTLRLAA